MSTAPASSSCEHLSYAKVPPANSPVIFKEECTQCYVDEFTPGGVNVCLTCYNGGCEEHGAQHSKITSHPIVLKIWKTKSAEPVEPPAKIVKLETGVEGGIPVDLGPKFDTHTKVLCLKCNVELDKTGEQLAAVVKAVLEADSATKPKVHKPAEEKGAPPSLPSCHHCQSLEQIADPPKLNARSLTQCSSCDVSNNLWMCLTCGELGCSRPQPQAPQLGGQGHAVAHWKKTGHTLNVKVGSWDGNCYDCDIDLHNPNLDQQLAHFGIDRAKEGKWGKNMEELTVDFNLSIDWSKVYSGEGKEEALVYGPGNTGLRNLGNSCYMASVVQVLFSLPAFQARYWGEARDHAKQCRSWKPSECFLCQMSKLAGGLMSGKYSRAPNEEEMRALSSALREVKEGSGAAVPSEEKKPEGKERENKDAGPAKVNYEEQGIRPRTFKKFVARNNADFQTTQQQDAAEFLHYFLEQIEIAEKTNGVDPTKTFKFKLEDRLECSECHCVRYTTLPASELQLPIPVPEPLVVPKPAEPPAPEPAVAGAGEGTPAPSAEAALEEAKRKAAREKAEEVQYPPVQLEKCIDEFTQRTWLDGYNCSECKKKTRAFKTTRFASFPDVLLVNMRRFAFDDKGAVKKLGLDIVVDDKEHNFAALKGTGLLPSEKAFPDAAKSAPAGPEYNAGFLAELEGMGLGRNLGIRALVATGNASADVAAAWAFDHMGDPGVNDPIAPAGGGSAGAGGKPEPPAEAVAEIEMIMGVPRARAVHALQQTDNNTQRAVDWLLSHPDDPIDAKTESKGPDPGAGAGAGDEKPPRYRLYAFITHLGKSTSMGHYVAHIRKEGKWIKFNDEKVSEDTQAPVGQGYIYFFRKILA